jgi:hypothetical protein
VPFIVPRSESSSESGHGDYKEICSTKELDSPVIKVTPPQPDDGDEAENKVMEVETDRLLVPSPNEPGHQGTEDKTDLVEVGDHEGRVEEKPDDQTALESLSYKANCETEDYYTSWDSRSRGASKAPSQDPKPTKPENNGRWLLKLSTNYTCSIPLLQSSPLILSHTPLSLANKGMASDKAHAPSLQSCVPNLSHLDYFANLRFSAFSSSSASSSSSYPKDLSLAPRTELHSMPLLCHVPLTGVTLNFCLPEWVFSLKKSTDKMVWGEKKDWEWERNWIRVRVEKDVEEGRRELMRKRVDGTRSIEDENVSVTLRRWCGI